MIVRCTNGTEIILKENERYFKVTSGNKTWYWNIDDGKFDGESFDLVSQEDKLFVGTDGELVELKS